MTATMPTNHAAWAKSIAKPAQEFPLTPLKLRSGAIPEGLQGKLYRNGPARLERGGMSVGHWFDGDGAVLSVDFADGKAHAIYRYVQTSGYREESKDDRFIFGGYGMVSPRAWWRRFGTSSKNVANTSVIAFPDRLLALWEGGLPHALDLETLETKGLENLDGLESSLPYSAHPKRDAQTGNIYNFGITYGKNATLHLYCNDRQGQLLKKNQIELSGLPMIHDFVMAGDYLVFCVPPVRLNPFPMLLQFKSYSDSLQWQPKEGTEILVFDRHTLELVSRTQTEAWFQWHFGNGHSDQDGNVVFNFIRYSDFSTNQFLKEVASGKVKTHAPGYFSQVRLNPKTGTILESIQLFDQIVEFPTVSTLQIGQISRYTYLSMQHPNTNPDLFGAIVRYDHQTQTATIADLGPSCYGSEPIFVSDLDNAYLGWVLTVVYDCDRNCSEVWIFNSEHLDQEPIARLELPAVIPMGFHGTWQSLTT